MGQKICGDFNISVERDKCKRSTKTFELSFWKVPYHMPYKQKPHNFYPTFNTCKNSVKVFDMLRMYVAVNIICIPP